MFLNSRTRLGQRRVLYDRNRFRRHRVSCRPNRFPDTKASFSGGKLYQHAKIQ
ncbi:hypothetical protein NEICINOT_04317 [Neisseria cinerea ATCC 14685]|uniref:Uncharacterized protein n=1 Tax=Neisseria cinerea ATCC 14685 TaxID=546262 RepID=D0W3S6_NEICI|nr:hypothetical protein NEICINOT_04317 [Neisseria cinerea ATCC 14685]